MPHEANTTISHYKILHSLGAGGMGEVYLAEDGRLRRKVALKVLPDTLSRDNERLRRFEQEALAASALNHPNILTIFEFGEEGGTHYLASEFIDGETLRERLRGGPLELNETLDIIIQTVQALSAAHEAGIIHRDIKPENVMLRKDGFVKVLDFGLAKLVETAPTGSEEDTRKQGMTREGTVMGTVAYMSPEQARGKAVDARTDQFSLGVMLYEMLSRRQPFTGETVNHVIVAILEKEPTPLAGIPDELKRILEKLLAKHTDERYGSTQAMLADLKKLQMRLLVEAENKRNSDDALVEAQTLIQPQAIAAPPEALVTAAASAQSTSPGHSKPKQWWLAAGLGVILAVGGFFGYRYFGRSPVNISFESSKSSRLTSSGKVWITAISPDGKWLAYAVRGEEQRSLWVKQVAVPDSDTRIVTTPESVEMTGLTFSPDGNFLYYSVIDWDVSTKTLYQVGVLGGTPRKILDGPFSEGGIYGSVGFSPDGKKIAYYNSNNGEQKLMIANADGSEPRQLAARRGDEIFFNFPAPGPSWSSDGKTIATSIGTSNPQTMSVAVVSVATGEITVWDSQKFSWTNKPTWLADGKGLLMLAREAEGQPNQIWQITYPAGEYKKLSNDVWGYDSISLTADSNVLAAMQRTGVSNISIFQTSDPNSAKQITSGTDRNQSPSWTPDGKLLFRRYSGGGSAIYLVDPREGIPKQLISDYVQSLDRLAVSPDGRFIVFTSKRSGSHALWRMDVDGGNLTQLTKTPGLAPDFSPDGREIIFHDADKSPPAILKVGIDGGEPVQLTDKFSLNPQFSPDGKQFLCVYRADPKSPGKIAIYSSDGGSPVKLLDPPKDLKWTTLRWMPDGRTITYVVTKGGVGNIWSKSLEGGTPKQITNFTGEQIDSFDFSPDGKQIAVARGTASSDVVLISGIKK